ncbi:tigger transposable element-derived protein 4-like isoform X1 [Ostrinia furnacalis]|uniref:tigger transposable element-derived protein 4-like isoform X1 n=2 Tax=Ostrinia furnacalis TaxID=93504 RepID=UPI00103F0C7A|nr:tigger transposable element-derived protein 4-like isoform X1 [Ostrinia furnacalis]
MLFAIIAKTIPTAISITHYNYQPTQTPTFLPKTKRGAVADFRVNMASKRKSLCVDEKVLLIRSIEAGEKISDVGRRFGFSRSTVSTIWKNKEKILQAEADGKSAKKLKKPQYEDLDPPMLAWFYNQRQNNVPVSGPIMKAKAEEIAKELGLTAFKASEGWLGRFKQRHHIDYGKINGEVQGVNAYLKVEYAPNDLSTAGETGISCNLATHKTLKFKAEKFVGGKLSKEQEQQVNEEDETDEPDSPPSIKQALDAAKVLEKYFLYNQIDPAASQVMSKIRNKIQLMYWSNKNHQTKLTD